MVTCTHTHTNQQDGRNRLKSAARWTQRRPTETGIHTESGGLTCCCFPGRPLFFFPFTSGSSISLMLMLMLTASGAADSLDESLRRVSDNETTTTRQAFRDRLFEPKTWFKKVQLDLKYIVTYFYFFYTGGYMQTHTNQQDFLNPIQKRFMKEVCTNVSTLGGS